MLDKSICMYDALLDMEKHHCAHPFSWPQVLGMFVILCVLALLSTFGSLLYPFFGEFNDKLLSTVCGSLWLSCIQYIHDCLLSISSRSSTCYVSLVSWPACRLVSDVGIYVIIEQAVDSRRTVTVCSLFCLSQGLSCLCHIFSFHSWHSLYYTTIWSPLASLSPLRWGK